MKTLQTCHCCTALIMVVFTKITFFDAAFQFTVLELYIWHPTLLLNTPWGWFTMLLEIYENGCILFLLLLNCYAKFVISEQQTPIALSLTHICIYMYISVKINAQGLLFFIQLIPHCLTVFQCFHTPWSEFNNTLPVSITKVIFLLGLLFSTKKKKINPMSNSYLKYNLFLILKGVLSKLLKTLHE